MHLSKRVLNFIAQNNLIEPNDNLLVAVSGGSDSMGLFSFLLNHKKELGYNRLSVAHVNHQLRGADADFDQELVELFCLKHNVPCFPLRFDVKQFAKENKLSIETAARQVRYKFFEQMAKEFGEKIVTAHNVNDNIETILFHMTRGISLKGLTGIPVRRGKVIRPFLCLTKEETEAYCRETDTPFTFDSTNFDTKYTRNKIRAQVLPVLEEINPGFINGFYNKFISVQEDSDFIEAQAKEAYQNAAINNTLKQKSVANLNRAIAKRVILKYLTDNTIEISNNLINDIYDLLCTVESGKLQINKDMWLHFDGDILFLKKEDDIPEFADYQIPVKHGAKYEKDGFLVEVTVLNRKDFEKKVKINKNVLKNSVDCDKLEKVAFIRNKRNGDKFFLQNRNVTKSLKKLFVEDQIPAPSRKKMPLLVNKGEVCWVLGYEPNSEVAVDDNTKKIATISCRGI